MMNSFSEALISRTSQFDRNLPWKLTKDPYSIWLSEVILQQTRVEQGTPYYLDFIKAFPTVSDLANAKEDDILRKWQGLGYYSRARNLHAAAKIILEKYEGKFPSNYNDILSLKGIGEYTAAAIASFAYDLPHPVLDGNVKRFLSRLLGITDSIESLPARHKLLTFLTREISKANPAEFNQAIMDFGSLICKPKNPLCQTCPFAKQCVAFNEGMIEILPVKKRSLPRKIRYLHYLVLEDKNGEILIKKRDGKDVWKGLFEFPVVETFSDDPITLDVFIDTLHLHDQIVSTILLNIKALKPHLLSHQELRICVYEAKLNSSHVNSNADYQRTDKNLVNNYGFPIVLAKYNKNRGI